MPAEMPQWITFSLDGRFALFCVGITGAAALLFGFAPILRASRADIRRALQDAAARTTAPRRRRVTLGVLGLAQK
jgi:hypothetical protein